MTASKSETADDNQSRGTTAQTHFDARDVLAGAVDETTVRQAASAGGRQ